MGGDPISRRDFLHYGAAAAAAGLIGPLPAGAETNAPSMTALLRSPDGGPLDSDKVKSIIARDLANDPLPQGITNTSGRSSVTLASEPLQLACRLAVPGFGEVYCYADNNGKGY